MKSIFDPAVREEIMRRIASLRETSTAEWGKMNVNQMLTHCARYDEMILRSHNLKQTLIGRIVGQRVLRDFIKDETPVKRNLPTLPQLRVVETGGDFGVLRDCWMKLINEFGRYSEPYFVHPFFGRMSKEQVGYLDYKHSDHHLRQFRA